MVKRVRTAILVGLVFMIIVIWEGVQLFVQVVVDSSVQNQVNDVSGVNQRVFSLVPEKYRGQFFNICSNHQIPPVLGYAMIEAESEWDHNTRSYNVDSVDVGLCQLNSKNNRWFKSLFPHLSVNDPYHNMYIGLWYLRQMHNKFGTWYEALAAYNAGPNAVISRRIPNSTKKYIEKISKIIDQSFDVVCLSQ